MAGEDTRGRESDGNARLLGLVARLPAISSGPGVYLFKDRQGRVIYVGKAVNLRARVRSYLRGGDERSQMRFLLDRLEDFDTLVTVTETEALILENNLIKQYRPRYNVLLKDDKSYASVKVTVRDAWPRVLTTRRIVKDGSRYFGPFPSGSAVRETLDLIQKAFPLRTCSDGVFRNRSRPCIEYQIRRCLGPCALPVDPAVYAEHLRQAMLLLEGRNREVVTALRRRMAEAADAERFEEAARLRDQVAAIEQTQERQRVADHLGADQDVVALYREGGAVEVQVLFVREGILVADQAYALDDWEFPAADVLEGVLTQFYQAGARDVPEEILLSEPISDAPVREEYLAARRGGRVTIAVPQRGEKRRLVELALANARQRFVARRSAAEQGARQVDELQRRLRLRTRPRRIECVDIATFHGGETVGAVVAFVDGQPFTAGYRRMRIRATAGPDDFGSVREVVRRRFRRAAEDGEVPDLLVIDGGAAQVAAGRAALAEHGLPDLPVIGLAKARVTPDAQAHSVTRKPERIFLPGRRNPLVLRRDSTALFLLQRVRDEAHRFANTYHRRLRGRSRLASTLDAVAGIGPERRGALLRHFGSVRRLRAATVDEIAAVPGVAVALAKEIKAHLTRN